MTVCTHGTGTETEAKAIATPSGHRHFNRSSVALLVALKGRQFVNVNQDCFFFFFFFFSFAMAGSAGSIGQQLGSLWFD